MQTILLFWSGDHSQFVNMGYDCVEHAYQLARESQMGLTREKQTNFW